jgi:hypothetical protein
MPAITNSVKKKLYAALPNVSLKVAEASLSVWELSEKKGINSLESVIIARVLKVLRVLLQSSSLGEAASSSSDLELLITLLSDPGVLSDLKHLDPLAAARLRGLRAKEDILNAEGGCLTAQEAAVIARVTKAAISKARKEGRLIGLPVGQKSWVFPRWQFIEPGGFLLGLKEVTNELSHLSAWGQAMFLLEPNDRLSGHNPLYWMRRGKVDKVILAAHQHGEQGAA